jgi:hypothetical protein
LCWQDNMVGGHAWEKAMQLALLRGQILLKTAGVGAVTVCKGGVTGMVSRDSDLKERLRRGAWMGRTRLLTALRPSHSQLALTSQDVSPGELC